MNTSVRAKAKRKPALAKGRTAGENPRSESFSGFTEPLEWPTPFVMRHR